MVLNQSVTPVPFPVTELLLLIHLKIGFPADLLRIHGAVPFAAIGDVALVALLNPADERLRGRLSESGKCRFYLTMPSSAEEWLDAAFSGDSSP